MEALGIRPSAQSFLACLVVDCSGSMDDSDKLEQARRGATEFVTSALARGHKVGLIKFSSSASILCKPTTDAAQLREAVASLSIEGSTNMAEGVALARSTLSDNKRLMRTIVLVTDGMPDDHSATIREADAAKAQGIDLIAIGTDDADKGFLAQIASRNDLALPVPRAKLSSGIASAASLLPSGPRQTG